MSGPWANEPRVPAMPDTGSSQAGSTQSLSEKGTLMTPWLGTSSLWNFWALSLCCWKPPGYHAVLQKPQVTDPHVGVGRHWTCSLVLLRLCHWIKWAVRQVSQDCGEHWWDDLEGEKPIKLWLYFVSVNSIMKQVWGELGGDSLGHLAFHVSAQDKLMLAA